MSLHIIPYTHDMEGKRFVGTARALLLPCHVREQLLSAHRERDMDWHEDYSHANVQ